MRLERWRGPPNISKAPLTSGKTTELKGHCVVLEIQPQNFFISDNINEEITQTNLFYFAISE